MNVGAADDHRIEKLTEFPPSHFRFLAIQINGITGHARYDRLESRSSSGTPKQKMAEVLKSIRRPRLPVRLGDLVNLRTVKLKNDFTIKAAFVERLRRQYGEVALKQHCMSKSPPDHSRTASLQHSWPC